MNVLILTFKLDEKQKVISCALKHKFESENCLCSIYDLEILAGLENAGDYCERLFSSLSDIVLHNDYDFIVSLDIKIMSILSYMRSCGFIKCPLFFIQSDYCFHKEFLTFDADICFLSTDLCVEKYTPKEKYVVTGIPVDNQITENVKNYGIGRILVFFADCFDFELVCETVDSICNYCHVMIVTAGTSSKIANKYMDYYKYKRDVSVVFDFDFDYHADIAVTCAHSIYSTVCSTALENHIILSSNRVYKSCDYRIMTEEIGMGIGCMNTEELKSVVISLLSCDNSTLYLSPLKSKCKYKDSATDIYNNIIEFIKIDNKERG